MSTRKGLKCDICGGDKKNQAKHCIECSSILSHLTQLKSMEEKIKEVKRIRKESIKDPAENFGLRE